MALYSKNLKKLQKDEPHVYKFAKALYQICRRYESSEERETFVDTLMEELLHHSGFGMEPFYIARQHTLITVLDPPRGGLISRPDFVVFRETNKIRLSLSEEIVAVAMENKVLKVDPQIGQAIGTCIAVALKNYVVNEKIQPLGMLRARGHFISFMKSEFDMEFLDSIILRKKEES